VAALLQVNAFAARLYADLALVFGHCDAGVSGRRAKSVSA
jgi:hypothetical protein